MVLDGINVRRVCARSNNPDIDYLTAFIMQSAKFGTVFNQKEIGCPIVRLLFLDAVAAHRKGK